jgi:hypothetical protein
MAEQSFDTPRMTRDQQRRIAAATAIGLNALKPMLQFQVSLLRLWANNIEMLARNCEKELKTFTFEAERQEEVGQRGSSARLNNFSGCSQQAPMHAMIHAPVSTGGGLDSASTVMVAVLG